MDDLRLTPTEAGFVTGRSRAAVNRAVDSGVIHAVVRRVGRRKDRLIGRPELRYLRIAEKMSRDLTPTGRRKLYEAVRHLSPDEHRVELGLFSVDLAGVDQEIEVKLQRLDELRGHVEADDGAEPVLRGTQVPVYVIAALVQGGSVEEVMGDYPSLTRAQIEGASEYASVFPKRGRPHPTQSLKRLLSDLDLGDLDMSRTSLGPRTVSA